MIGNSQEEVTAPWCDFDIAPWSVSYWTASSVTHGLCVRLNFQLYGYFCDGVTATSDENQLSWLVCVINSLDWNNYLDFNFFHRGAFGTDPDTNTSFSMLLTERRPIQCIPWFSTLSVKLNACTIIRKYTGSPILSFCML